MFLRMPRVFRKDNWTFLGPGNEEMWFGIAKYKNRRSLGQSHRRDDDYIPRKRTSYQEYSSNGTAIDLEVGSRQGGPRTPSGWNQLVATLVDELVRLWANSNPAVEWALEWKEFLWADNIFLVTSSASEPKRRTQEVANVFKKKKLFFNQSSLEILPIRAVERTRSPLVLEDKKECSWVHTLLVLGCFKSANQIRAEDVQQTPADAVLPANSGGRKYQCVLHHRRG